MQDPRVAITITSSGFHVGHARATEIETTDKFVAIEDASEGQEGPFAEALGGLHD